MNKLNIYTEAYQGSLKKEEKNSDILKLDKHTKFWCVVDKMSKDTELVDVLFETDVVSLCNMAKGGLDPKEENLTIYLGKNSKERAEIDAKKRLKDDSTYQK